MKSILLIPLVALVLFISVNAEASVQNYTIIPWNGSEYDFVGDAAIFTKNMTQISILESGKEYYVIQKIDFKAENFANNVTKVNATVGYAIQQGDKIIRPPMGENVTNADVELFHRNLFDKNDEFTKQSPIGNSYDFVLDIKNPFYMKFPFIINESGQYTRQFYQITHIFEGPSGYEMGGLVIVDKFSKAVNENAECKNDEHRRLIRYDYSTVVCVDSSSAFKLIERGWGI